MELDGFRVVHAGLDHAADDLKVVVDGIDSRLQRLDHELTPLRSDWVGDAQLAYVAAKRRWDRAIAEMRDLLRQTAQQLIESNACYLAADARGARTFDP